MSSEKVIPIGKFVPTMEVKKLYQGKVRTCFDLNGKFYMAVTDKISAFDVVLPQAIPYKGQVLNQIAAKFLAATEDIVPNWRTREIHPMVTVGDKCEPFMIEMIIRGILTGSLWRLYRNEGYEGVKEKYGIDIPEGMKENQAFSEPIITPTTKAETGRDEPITRAQIIEEGFATAEEYDLLVKYTREIFQRGQEMAEDVGLILVDTKYEFGKRNGEIILIDEIHTPDSSRYFYLEGHDKRVAHGERPKQLSKEFVREWLMEQGFKGEDGQKVPEMTLEFVQKISERYIELYEIIMGEKFEKVSYTIESVQKAIENSLKPRIAIIMGSTSDWKFVRPIADKLKEQQCSLYFAARSAHRTPAAVEEFVEWCNDSDIDVILAAAGLAAALPGCVAALTNIPVVGIALDGGGFEGMDAILAIAQMPPGVPAVCVSICDIESGPESNHANMIAKTAILMSQKFSGINIVLESNLTFGSDHKRVKATMDMLEAFDQTYKISENIDSAYINLRFLNIHSEDLADHDNNSLTINCIVADDGDGQDSEDCYVMSNVSEFAPVVGLNRGENLALQALRIMANYDTYLYKALQWHQLEQEILVLKKEADMEDVWAQYS